MYDVTVRTVDPQPTLTMHASDVTYDRIGKALMERLPKVWRYASAKGVTPDGPPVVRYSNFRPDRVDLDGGVTLPGRLEGEGDIEAGELGGVECAVTIHTGPYRELGNAHTALQHWARDNGRETLDWNWEVYVNDPQETPEGDLITHVYQPLK